jgi:hypothetical protein
MRFNKLLQITATLLAAATFAAPIDSRTVELDLSNTESMGLLERDIDLTSVTETTGLLERGEPLDLSNTEAMGLLE